MAKRSDDSRFGAALLFVIGAVILYFANSTIPFILGLVVIAFAMAMGRRGWG